ncbi:MAG: AmmeMemoRadiSam system radical SAM enzyme [Deltaproteobacteria bacterium]|nr:AmmeMemoRadiSam system radical SAM enzyme [Deltaproteobacteria bacterium]
MLYEHMEGSSAACRLCAHRCVIGPSKRGICGVRENHDGVLYSLVYGLPVSAAVDPIEKKPLYHVYPGSRSYSIATVGCNFRCTFCQNHDISQAPRESGRIIGNATSPEDIVAAAVRSSCRSISYTYTEPTIFFEYAHDVGLIAHRKGLANIFVTNGYMTSEALEVLHGLLDGANVDLKSFRDDFYREHCGGRLQPVLDALEKMKASGVWLEITTLLIPGLNDDGGELRDLARFINTLGRETPWHVSRFYPQYRMTGRPATPESAVRRALEIGREEGLLYVYAGNLPGDDGESTFCPGCGNRLIGRHGYRITENNLKNGACLFCLRPMEGLL